MNNLICIKKNLSIYRDNAWIIFYDYEKELIVGKIKIKDSIEDILNVLKGLNGLKSLSVLLDGYDDNTKDTIYKIIEKCKDTFFEEVSDKNILRLKREQVIDDFIHINKKNYFINEIALKREIKRSIQNANVILIGHGYLAKSIIKNLKLVGINKINVIKEEDEGDNNKVNDQMKISDTQLIEGDINLVLEKQQLKKYLIENENVILIYCEDKIIPENVFSINDLCLKSHKCLSILFADEEYLSIGPTIFPDETGCCKCENTEEHYKFYLDMKKINYAPQLYEFELLSSLWILDFFKILGSIPTYMIEDVSLTLGKQFLINKSNFSASCRELLKDRNCNHAIQGE